MKKIFYLIIGVVLLGTGCRKDITKFIPDPTPNPTFIISNFGGSVIDENGVAIEGATVAIQTSTGIVNVTTDKNGIFVARNLEVQEDLAYVKVELDGYFLGSKSLYVSENKINHLTIKLLPKTIIGNFSGVEGGTVQANEGIRLEFPPNAIVQSNGESYDGSVQIAARWLNPTAEDLMQIMPGALVGLNVENEIVALATAGMMAVELIGDNGQVLNLGNDAMANLTFPLTAEMANFNLPEVIPLWYFDEENGIWIEEGSANLVGDSYVGAVSHFSFWNCDDPFSVVHASGKVLDSEGNPLPNVAVQIRVSGTSLVGSGWTDAAGCYNGYVPQNENLTIEILDDCWSVVTTQFIEPLSSSTTLPNIEVDLDGASVLNISGDLVNCVDEPVTNGYIKISTFNESFNHFFINNDGSFSATVLNCGQDSLNIQGFDVDSLAESSLIGLTAAPIVDAGTIVVCDALPEFINFNLSGTDYTVIEPSGGLEAASVGQVYGGNEATVAASLTWFGGDLDVEYNLSALDITIQGVTYTMAEGSVMITELGAVEELMKGQFVGVVLDENQESFSISGNFQIIRNF